MKTTASLLLLSSAVTASWAAETQQPNIIMLFVDDLGWSDLGYNNPQYETPNIDMLASKGLNFTQAYVSTATSSPSRASLLTGKEALRCGFVRHIYDDNNEGEFQSFERDPRHMLSRSFLPYDEITYAERLKELGYHTTHIGKWHLGYEEYFPDKQGFDEVIGTAKYGHPKSYYMPFFAEGNPYPDAKKDDYLTDLIAESSANYIKGYEGAQPLLLNVWFYGVHGPNIGRRDLVAKYKAQGMTTKLAHYHAMVESVDMAVGKIMSAVNERGVADNTIIIFSSDQGGAFDNYPLSGGKMGGNTLGEGGTRVPFIIYAPKAAAMGECYDKAIQTIDIYPTMVEYASGERCRDKQINGVSLRPIIDGGDIKSRDLFLHRSYEDQHCAIVRGEWKLIMYTSGKVELFNLKSDISETTNLVDVYPKIVKSMNSALERWVAEATPQELLTK